MVWSMNFVRDEGMQQRLDDGLGDAGSIRLARCSRTMSSSESFSRARNFKRAQGARRQAGGFDRAHIQPDP